MLLSFTNPRKERRIIMKKVRNYIEHTVTESLFTLDKERLLLLLDYYFLSRGYTCTGLSQNQIVYSKVVTYTTGGDRTYYDTPGVRENYSFITPEGDVVSGYRDVPVKKTKRIYKTHEEYAKVLIEYIPIDETFAIIAQKIRTHTADHPFEELNLLRFLYSQCYGNNLALPRELSNEIEAYNQSQIKKRKRIVFN